MGWFFGCLSVLRRQCFVEAELANWISAIVDRSGVRLLRVWWLCVGWEIIAKSATLDIVGLQAYFRFRSDASIAYVCF